MFTSRLAILAFAGGLALASAPASAALMVAAVPTGTGINAINAACSFASGAPGTTIYGCLNTDHDLPVQYSSSDTIDFTAGGQAKIAPSGSTSFDNLTISLVGYTFNTLVLNIETAANGSVTFTDNFGDPAVVMPLAAAGNNFFTITGADFSWISFTSTVDAVDVKQVRFDGLKEGGGSENPPPGVPEPATLAVFGMALAGLGALRRRSKRTA